MKFPRLLGSAGHDLAIDLGTVNTLVYVRNKGIVLDEPSVIAFDTIGGIRRIKAVGNEAKLMLGKTPEGVKAVRPLRDGVIADIDIAEQMIRHFVEKATGGSGFFRRG
ncbi:MAG: rod shape-determining protein, partial [Sphingobium sp.]